MPDLPPFLDRPAHEYPTWAAVLRALPCRDHERGPTAEEYDRWLRGQIKFIRPSPLSEDEQIALVEDSLWRAYNRWAPDETNIAPLWLSFVSQVRDATHEATRKTARRNRAAPMEPFDGQHDRPVHWQEHDHVVDLDSWIDGLPPVLAQVARLAAAGWAPGEIRQEVGLSVKQYRTVRLKLAKAISPRLAQD